jgi:hypothetical protein
MKRIPRPLQWIFGRLLVVEILYVLAGVIPVRSGQVDRWINDKAEKRTVSFESAWSLVPGVAWVKGVRWVNQGRGNRFPEASGRQRDT